MAKISVVGLRGIPGVMGGVETHCEQIYPRLKALRPNDEFTIIARNGYVPREPFHFAGVRVQGLWHARHKYLESITSTLAGVLYSRLVLRSEIIHFHAIGPALLAPLARLLGARVVVTHHGQDYQRAKWNPMAKAALRFGEICALRSAHALVAVSPSLAEDLKRRYPAHAERIHYIPNGANHGGRGPASPKAVDTVLRRFGLEPKRYILAVGRLVPEKGFHDLIAAYRRSGLDAKLVIVGAADHRDEYADRLKAEADDSVVFTGFLGRDDVQGLLSASGLFVLPSYHEGLPIAALEAINAGAPILLSDIQANKDLGVSPEHYVKVGDVAALTEGLQRGFGHFKAIPKSVAEPFDWDRVSEATNEVYTTVQESGWYGPGLKMVRPLRGTAVTRNR
jgi:glycosyltransferase involved in cell wall biosynthesis